MIVCENPEGIFRRTHVEYVQHYGGSFWVCVTERHLFML